MGLKALLKVWPKFPIYETINSYMWSEILQIKCWRGLVVECSILDLGIQGSSPGRRLFFFLGFFFHFSYNYNLQSWHVNIFELKVFENDKNKVPLRAKIKSFLSYFRTFYEVNVQFMQHNHTKIFLFELNCITNNKK